MSISTYGTVDWYSTPAQDAAAKAKAEGNSGSTVTHDEFLKLLITQLTHQDPLSPMEDIDFTAQLAQLQALEEQIALNSSFKALRMDTQLQAANAMIGLYVVGPAVRDAAGEITGYIEGVVERTMVEDSIAYLVLDNNQRIAVTEVTSTSSVVNNSDVMASAGALVGMFVSGYTTDGKTAAEGIVEKAVLLANGQVGLQLYGGKTVPMTGLVELRVPTEDEVWFYLPDDLREEAEEARALVDQSVTIRRVVDGVAVEKSGIVREAVLDGDSIKLVLHDGTVFQVAEVTKYHAPTSDELLDAANGYAGQYIKGTDVNGNEVEGIIVSGEWPSVNDAMVFTLQDGSEMLFGAAEVLRDATDAEREQFLGSDGIDDGDGETIEDDG